MIYVSKDSQCLFQIVLRDIPKMEFATAGSCRPIEEAQRHTVDHQSTTRSVKAERDILGTSTPSSGFDSRKDIFELRANELKEMMAQEPVQAIISFATPRQIQIYHDISRSGPDHVPTFTHCVTLQKGRDRLDGIGRGRGKKEAKDEAHRLLLESLALHVVQDRSYSPHSNYLFEELSALRSEVAQDLGAALEAVAIVERRLGRIDCLLSVLRSDEVPPYYVDRTGVPKTGSFNPYGNGQFGLILAALWTTVRAHLPLPMVGPNAAALPLYTWDLHCTNTQNDSLLFQNTDPCAVGLPPGWMNGGIWVESSASVPFMMGIQVVPTGQTPVNIDGGSVSFPKEFVWANKWRMVAGGTLWYHTHVYPVVVPAGSSLYVSCLHTAVFGGTWASGNWLFDLSAVYPLPGNTTTFTPTFSTKITGNVQISNINETSVDGKVNPITPVWVTMDKPGMETEWQLSHKERNKLQHSLHGNEDSADFKGDVMAAALATIGSHQSVTISDIKIVPARKKATKKFGQRGSPLRPEAPEFKSVEPELKRELVETDPSIAVNVPAIEADVTHTADYCPYHESLKANPFHALDCGLFLRELRSVADDLPHAAREYYMTLIDDDACYNAGDNEVWRDVMVSESKEPRREKPTRPSKKEINGVAPPSPSPADSEVDKKGSHKKLMEKYKRIAQRKAQSFKTWGQALDWICGGDHTPDALCIYLLQECRKQDWGDRIDANHCVFKNVVNKQDHRTLLYDLCEWSTRLRTLSQSRAFDLWLDARFPNNSKAASRSIRPRVTLPTKEWDDSEVIKAGSFNAYGNEQIDGYARYLQSNRNRSMHAQNGNQDWTFPNSMTDIQAYPTLRSLLETDGSVTGSYQNLVNEVARHTGLLGPQGLNMGVVSRETPLRGAIATAANAVALFNDIPAPEALLWPATVRVAADIHALADNEERPYVFGIGLVRRDAMYPLVETVSGTAIRNIVDRMGNIRPDQITKMGFKTSDVAALMNIEPGGVTNGDSLQAVYTKLMLYSLSRTWNADPNFLPLGGQPGKFDSYTQLEANPVVTPGWDDGTVYGSDCGGAVAPIFPYLAADNNPTIAFHTSMATVPNGQSFIMLSPGLLLQNSSGYDAINIFFLALAMAPYPCGIHSMTITTTDENGENAGDQEFIPFSDLVHMPGLSVLNILLPSRNAGAPPGNQVDANSQVLVQPTAGPTAVGGWAAGVQLNVSFIGVGGLQTYDLATYLSSWMSLPNSPVNYTNLTVFYRQVAQTFGRVEDIRFCWELACSVAVRYPVMIACASGSTPRFDPGTEVAGAHQNFMALTPTQMAQDFPQEFEAFDVYIPDLNYTWWNKVMSGAYMAGPDQGQYPPTQYEFEGSPRALQYAMHAVRAYAAAAEHVFTYFQQSAQVWDNSFTQQNYLGVLEEMRGIFTAWQGSAQSGAIISELGEALAVMHTRVNGFKPGVDMYGNTIWHYLNVPVVGFQRVHDEGGNRLNTPTPCVLADIWLQLQIVTPSRATSPFLAGIKNLTGLKVADGQVTALGGGSYSTPIATSQIAREVALDTIPLLDDDQLFNQRLVFHRFTADLYTLNGNVWNTSTVGSGSVVSQKWCVSDWTTTNQLNCTILTSNTRWMPFMTPSGLRLTVGVSALNGSALMTQIMAGKQVTGVATWLLRKAVGMPNTIIDGGGGNKVSKLKRYRQPKNSSPSYGPASDAGEEKGPMLES